MRVPICHSGSQEFMSRRCPQRKNVTYQKAKETKQKTKTREKEKKKRSRQGSVEQQQQQHAPTSNALQANMFARRVANYRLAG